MASRQLNLLDKSIAPGRIILMLAWPVFIEQLLQILVSYVDTAMVASLGVDASAAVAVNSSFIHLTQGLVFGLGAGFSVLVSRSIGEKREDYAKEITRQSVIMSLILGLFMMFIYLGVVGPNLATIMHAEESIHETAKQYVMIVGMSRLFFVGMQIFNNIHRGAGDTKTPMRCNIINNLINVVFNFLFIYSPRDVIVFGKSIHIWGAGWGVAGAAIATSMGAVAAGLLSFFALYRKNYVVGLNIRDKIRFNGKIMKDALSIGIPISIDRVIVSSGQMVVTRLLAGLGNATLAAHNFANTAESMCYMPIMGFSVSAQTLVAQSLGAKDVDLAKKFYKKCMQYAIAVMSCCAVLMFIFAPKLIGFFADDADVIRMGAAALRVQAFAEPCFAATNVCGGLLKGAGDAKYSVYVSIIGMWCVRIVLAVVLITGFGWGLLGIWLPMALDWYARCFVMVRRVRSEKWLHAWKIS